MKLSLITVTFNSASTIKDTIESVLAQTYEDYEYLIIDGACMMVSTRESGWPPAMLSEL